MTAEGSTAPGGGCFHWYCGLLVCVERFGSEIGVVGPERLVVQNAGLLARFSGIADGIISTKKSLLARHSSMVTEVPHATRLTRTGLTGSKSENDRREMGMVHSYHFGEGFE